MLHGIASKSYTQNISSLVVSELIEQSSLYKRECELKYPAYLVISKNRFFSGNLQKITINFNSHLPKTQKMSQTPRTLVLLNSHTKNPLDSKINSINQQKCNIGQIKKRPFFPHNTHHICGTWFFYQFFPFINC